MIFRGNAEMSLVGSEMERKMTPRRASVNYVFNSKQWIISLSNCSSEISKWKCESTHYCGTC